VRAGGPRELEPPLASARPSVHLWPCASPAHSHLSHGPLYLILSGLGVGAAGGVAAVSLGVLWLWRWGGLMLYQRY
jgi:hypothetical protein